MKPANGNDGFETKRIDTITLVKECLNDISMLRASELRDANALTLSDEAWLETWVLPEGSLIRSLLDASLPKRIDDTDQPQNWKELAQAALLSLGAHALDTTPHARLDEFYSLSKRAYIIANPQLKVLPEKK